MRKNYIVILLFMAFTFAFSSELTFKNKKNLEIYNSAQSEIYETNNFDNALKNLEKLISKDEIKNPDVYALLGMGYYKKSLDFKAYYKKSPDYKIYLPKSLEMLEKSYDMGLMQQVTIFLLADIYYEIGNSLKAVEFYNLSLKFGDNPASYLGLGIVYNKLERYDESVKVLDKYIKEASNNAEGYYQRSIAYTYSNELTKALSDGIRALELSKDRQENYYMNLAIIYMKKNENTTALEYINKADLLAKNWGILKIRSEIYEKLGENEKADADLKESQELKANEK